MGVGPTSIASQSMSFMKKLFCAIRSKHHSIVDSDFCFDITVASSKKIIVRIWSILMHFGSQ